LLLAVFGRAFATAWVDFNFVGGATVQTTLLGSAIALILALLAALVGPYFVNWNDQRAFFEAEASRLVGTTVRVAGDIDAAILPVPSVTLREIAIGSGGDANRLRARSLRIDLSLGPLMRGEFRAAEMQLVAPQLSVGLDRAGRIDWPPLALATETLSIDHLRIEDGRAILTEAASSARLVLDRLWFAGEVRSLTGPIRGRGEFVTGGRRYGYDISTGRQSADGMRIKLALSDNERPMTITADGMLAVERAAPRFAAVVTLSRPAAAAASGKTKAREPWRLSSKIVGDVSAAVLDDVSFQYGADERAVALTGSAKFDFGARPSLRGNLTASQIDLDRLLTVPNAPRRLPFAAVQALGELLGGAMRPWLPATVSFNVGAAMLGGAPLQGIAVDLRSDGEEWTVNRLELRAPGLSRVRLQGKLYAVGNGLGFAGGAEIDSSDAKTLLAWATGTTASIAQAAPWRAKGDITLSPDRIAVERLQTEFQRGAVTGSLAYSLSTAKRPARLEADLRAANLDIDALYGAGRAALSGAGLEGPGEVALTLDIGAAQLAGLQGRDVKAKLSLDANGVVIERLSVADFGDSSIEARGRIRTVAAPGGNVTVDLDARDLKNLLGLTEKFVPTLAEPLRRLTNGQKSAKLHATVALANHGANDASGTLDLSGTVGAVRVKASARVAGKRDVFTLAKLPAIAGADLRFNGTLESEEASRLLALIGLDRMPVIEKRLGRLSLSANGPAGGDLRLDGRIDVGPMDVAGKGVLRRPADGPMALDLDRFAGTIGGNKMQGRLELRFGDAPHLDGAIEMEALNAPATVAVAIGMPVSREPDTAAPGWSTEPFAFNVPGLAGQIAFKAQRADLSPEVVVRNLNGVARFSWSELAFENVSGELAKGRLEGRLAFGSGADGLSARLNAGVTGVDAGALFGTSGHTPIKGRLALQTELEGAGRSPAALIGSISGFGRLTLEQGEFAGFNPGVFGAAARAVERGAPTDDDHIRKFVSGELDTATLPVSRASAAISVSAGQAHFGDIVIASAAADLQATAKLDLSDGTLDALLTFTDTSVPAGAMPPSILVALKGPPFAPVRTVDTGLLTGWLTAHAIEWHSKQIEALERARREADRSQSATSEERNGGGQRVPAEKIGNMAVPAPSAAETESTGGLTEARRAPALPPPIDITAGPKPLAIPRSPGLVGAQP
jgi:uncharacterized protein involved in outer membrane biogenesis